MSSETVSLLPCPFCGAPADPEGWSSIDRKGPACTNPRCNGAADSAEAWNRRSKPVTSGVDGLIDAARNASMYLRTGFIECDRCGHEVQTANTDAQYELDQALSAFLPKATAPVAWQRRIKYPSIPGDVPQWEPCPSKEATGHFERSPLHEYRPLYASPQPEAVITEEMERLKSLVERAFKDGVAYAGNVRNPDPDIAWGHSAVRQALSEGEQT